MIWNERIKALRESKNLTLKDVAKVLNISEATAQRYESTKGIKNIPYDSLIALADLFGVHPSYLMGWDEMPDISPEALQIALAYDQANETDRALTEKVLGIDFKKRICQCRLVWFGAFK